MHLKNKGLGAFALVAALFCSVFAAASALADTPAFSGGDGSKDSPYQIANETDLESLKSFVDGGGDTTGVYFEQTADIEMTKSWSGIGVVNSKWGSADNRAMRFYGTYDGKHHAISNVIFSTVNYGGFFNRAENATIKNLEINVAGRDYTAAGAGKGNGMVVGMASNMTFSCVLVTGAISNEHNTAGFCVKALDTEFVDCTNRCEILSTADKVAGFIAFDQLDGGAQTPTNFITFTRCANEADVTGTLETEQRNGGAAGFIARYDHVTLTFEDCSSFGSFTWHGLDSYAQNRQYGGSFIGSKSKNLVVMKGTNTASADQRIVGYLGYKNDPSCSWTQQVNIAFATVQDNVATIVTPEDGVSPVYKAMANVAPYDLKNADSTITIDESLETAKVITSYTDGEHPDYTFSVASTTNSDGTKTYSVSLDTVVLTVTPASTATYSATADSTAVSFENDAGSVPKTATVVVTAVAKDAAHAYRGDLPSGWTKTDDTTVTCTINSIAEDTVLTIPAPTAVKTVEVEEIGGYTNLQFTVSVAAATTCTIIAKDKTGAVIGQVAGKQLQAGDTVLNVGVDEFGANFEIGQFYSYEVVDAGSASVGKVTYADVGWVTNSYFAARASGTEQTLLNGAWTANEPDVADSVFKIASTGTVFGIETVAQNDSTRKIVQIDYQVTLDSYYLVEDLATDIPEAIAAVALATNETSEALSWMGLQNGEDWIALTGNAPKTLGTYTVRMELDYNAAQVYVRYSVMKSGTSDWVPLLDSNGNEWIAAKNNAESVKDVCFCGKADLATLDSKLATTAVAEVDGTDYTDILLAMGAASETTPMVLNTNIQVDPTTLTVGEYDYIANDKTFVAAPHVWRKADGQATLVSTDGSKISVTKADFVARIGADDETGVMYYALGTALADGNDTTVCLVKEIAANVTSEVDSVTLDLNGLGLTSATSGEPVLVAKGGALAIAGGSITNADAAAISALDGAVVTIGEIVVTNNTKAVYAANGSTVVVSNGLFTGAFETETTGTESLIAICGGYLLANDGVSVSFTGNVKAEAGRFTTAAKAAAAEVPATDYKFSEFALPVSTNGFEIAWEVMPVVKVSGEPVDTKTWVITNEVGEAEGTAQLPDSFVATVAGDDWSETTEKKQAAQEKLNEQSAYTGGKVKNWQCYVLGMQTDATTQGPRPEAVQGADSAKVNFKLATPEVIKAVESGCEVKYEVEAYDTPNGTLQTGEGSGKVNWDETAEVANPSAVRYYKIKVYVAPKQ